MPLILAINDDRHQSAQLAALVRERLPHVELVQAASTLDGMGALGDRIPDLILTSPLLSPWDEGVLDAHLRDFGPAAAHVQTLRIPVLHSTPSGASGGGGMLSRLRGKKKTTAATPEGCDPNVFADEIAAYLKRAADDLAEAEKRAAIASAEQAAIAASTLDEPAGDAAALTGWESLRSEFLNPAAPESDPAPMAWEAPAEPQTLDPVVPDPTPSPWHAEEQPLEQRTWLPSGGPEVAVDAVPLLWNAPTEQATQETPPEIDLTVVMDTLDAPLRPAPAEDARSNALSEALATSKLFSRPRVTDSDLAPFEIQPPADLPAASIIMPAEAAPAPVIDWSHVLIGEAQAPEQPLIEEPPIDEPPIDALEMLHAALEDECVDTIETAAHAAVDETVIDLGGMLKAIEEAPVHEAETAPAVEDEPIGERFALTAVSEESPVWRARMEAVAAAPPDVEAVCETAGFPLIEVMESAPEVDEEPADAFRLTPVSDESPVWLAQVAAAEPDHRQPAPVQEMPGALLELMERAPAIEDEPAIDPPLTAAEVVMVAPVADVIEAPVADVIEAPAAIAAEETVHTEVVAPASIETPEAAPEPPRLWSRLSSWIQRPAARIRTHERESSMPGSIFGPLIHETAAPASAAAPTDIPAHDALVDPPIVLPAAPAADETSVQETAAATTLSEPLGLDLIEEWPSIEFPPTPAESEAAGMAQTIESIEAYQSALAKKLRTIAVSLDTAPAALDAARAPGQPQPDAAPPAPEPAASIVQPERVREEAVVAAPAASAIEDERPAEPAPEALPLSEQSESKEPQVRRAREKKPQAARKPAAKKPAAKKATKKKTRPEEAKPVQDEWGLFDPNQCGFAALLEKLDEETDQDQAQNQKQRKRTSVRVISYG